jgi:hypothetical protein
MFASFEMQACEFGRSKQRGWLRARTATTILAAVLVWLASGCAATLIAPYDQKSVDRTTEISKSIIGLYQQLLSTEPEKRAALVKGPLAPRYDEIATQIRVHLLLESARAKNSESTTIATTLLDSWQEFSAHQRSPKDDALTNATLNVQRQILERELRSALVAEESKKLGGGADK